MYNVKFPLHFCNSLSIQSMETDAILADSYVLVHLNMIIKRNLTCRIHPTVHAKVGWRAQVIPQHLQKYYRMSALGQPTAAKYFSYKIKLAVPENEYGPTLRKSKAYFFLCSLELNVNLTFPLKRKNTLINPLEPHFRPKLLDSVNSVKKSVKSSYVA